MHVWARFCVSGGRLVPVVAGFQKRLICHSRVRHKPFGFPRLSPQQVKSILRRHDIKVDTDIPGAVKYFESNQLAANNPIEDRRAEGRCVQTNAILFGVFDGHAGCACAQAIRERLLDYLATSLLPTYLLENFMDDFTPQELCYMFEHDVDYTTQDRTEIYLDSLQLYAQHLLSSDDMDSSVTIEDLITRAFVRLDADISSEALPKADGSLDHEALQIALSGACACVVYVDGVDVYVANTGDCRALLISYENNNYIAKPLSNLHDSSNEAEVHRIRCEHPASESATLIKGERLLGQLIPTRAFGDVTYKWPVNVLKRVIQSASITPVLSSNYHTPPYLTAQPEVTHHTLSPKDKCLVLATDGLWDMLSMENVAKIIGQHMQSRQTVEPYRPEKVGHSRLGAINKALLERKVGLANRASDDNGATHLVRYALGGTDRGIEHSKLSNLLCIPEDMVRSFRDDITVTVIYFDDWYIKETLASH